MVEDIEKKVKEVIIKCIGTDLTEEELTLEYKLIEELLDSMSVTRIILGIEEQLGIYIDEDDLSEELFSTVGNLVEYVRTKIDQ